MPTISSAAPIAAVPIAPASAPPAIYDLARLYDLVVRPGPCEAFYCELAQQVAAETGRGRVRILDLACGTGRLTLPLARAGHGVSGLDLSPAMLEAACAKADAEHLSIAFVRGDMRSFDLGQRFALIVIGCNSLAHLVANEDLRACFRTIRHHLAPGGMVAFDIMNPDVRALGRGESERIRLDLGPNPSSAIAVEEEAAYDPIQQVRTARWRVRDALSGIPVREIAPLHLRMIFPQELPLLLEAEGLQLVARYGDFAGNSLTGDSLNQVCLARAQ